MFVNKQIPREKLEDLAKESYDELSRFFKIGKTFNYLGRECVVTKISVEQDYLRNYYLVYFEFDYVDDHGVIHNRRVDFDEFPALKAYLTKVT